MKKENMNNKGFSLVELIIVIAIMAILIVVLAPQYLKYVERSRNSTDLQNVRTLMTAVETYAADPQTTKALPATFDITITSAGTSNAVSDATTVGQAIKDAGLTLTDIKCSSKTAWASYKIKGKVESHGGVTWTFESYEKDDGTGANNGNLASKMKGNS